MQPRFDLFLPLLLAAGLSAQDLLYYRFDENCGTEAINFAVGSTVPAGTVGSTLSGAPATSWTTGRFGTALAGSDKVANQNNWLTTNWNPGTFTGDFSVSMWLRNRPGNPAAIAFGYLFGVDGPNFRLFTGSSGILFLSGWGGTNVTNTTNLTTLLNSGWTHVAVTLDHTTMQATWYVNGIVDRTMTMSAAVNFTGTNFAVGARGTNGANSSPLETDDFLFTQRVLTPAEVATLAVSTWSGDGRFGSSCGPVLTGSGQRPFVGNGAYGLTLQHANPGLGWVVFGTGRCTLSGIFQLPVDLGMFHPGLAGCLGHIDSDLGALGAFVVNGTANVNFPLPPQPLLLGYTVYGQAIVLDGPSGQLRGGNAIGIGIGS